MQGVLQCQEESTSEVLSNVSMYACMYYSSCFCKQGWIQCQFKPHPILFLITHMYSLGFKLLLNFLSHRLLAGKSFWTPCESCRFVFYSPVAWETNATQYTYNLTLLENYTSDFFLHGIPVVLTGKPEFNTSSFEHILCKLGYVVVGITPYSVICAFCFIAHYIGVHLLLISWVLLFVCAVTVDLLLEFQFCLISLKRNTNQNVFVAFSFFVSVMRKTSVWFLMCWLKMSLSCFRSIASYPTSWLGLGWRCLCPLCAASVERGGYYSIK